MSGTKPRRFKDAIYRQLARVGKAVASPRRLELLDLLAQGPQTVERLARETGQSVANTSQHLQLLRRARLAEIRRITRDFLADRGALEAVDQAVLVGRVQRGEVTLLDVRPVEEYAAGHILGAVSVPLRELEHRLAGLPKRRQIVAYCRGPYCVLAMEAVARLRALGFKALRLEDGIPDWRARGLPVAVGAP